jgi:hypothetical protein
MRTYTDEQLREAIVSSTSIRQVLIKLGLNPKGGGAYRSIHQSIKTLCIDTSHFKGQGWSQGNTLQFKIDTGDYLSNKKKVQSYKLKIRLIKEKLLLPKCNVCCLEEWMNKPIPLELDHKDGNHYNNNLSNLQLLCPNCHAQTPTHAGKNKGKTSYLLT